MLEVTVNIDDDDEELTVIVDVTSVFHVDEGIVDEGIEDEDEDAVVIDKVTPTVLLIKLLATVVIVLAAEDEALGYTSCGDRHSTWPGVKSHAASSWGLYASRSATEMPLLVAIR
jgi:hypothetical protein